MSRALRAAAVAALLLAATACASAPAYEVAERSISELQADLSAGEVTSEQLVGAYLARIEQIDNSGPTLSAVLAVNPDALADARALDAERAAGQLRGPLHGVPILIKDNIEAAGPLPTTAGSLALADNVTGRDAFVVQRLRAAGAIIIGKTNLSEWANIRSSMSSSGWSAVSGLTRNPYALDRNACGSSSGSGAAAAASLAAGAIGTETDGSIVCPSAINGLVGVKPTLGLVSRFGVVPISSAQDTPGPMARTVRDAALILTAIAGSDPRDAQTAEADAHRTDYAAGLSADALRGARIGVLRFQAGFHPGVDARFNAALETLRAAGAELVEIAEAPAGLDAISNDEFAALLAELKTELNAYLADTPERVEARTLADVIAFNQAEARELQWFGQDLFETAQATQGAGAPEAAAARQRARAAAMAALDAMLAGQDLDALAAPTTGPAWTTDLVNGDHYVGGSASMLPAVAGYPHVTTPMGRVSGLPVGLSLIGPAWSEARLLGYAYAFEQRANARTPPTYAAHIEDEAAPAPLER
ncbi:MAG: amidase [Hyphomonadaceae bacterium]|nr:amidase [Hyphomonadaceae bacterium]